MRATFAFVGITALLMSTAASGVDTMFAAKIGLVKPAKLAKFVSEPTIAQFPLPSGATDPSKAGAQISFFDTTPSGGGSFTHALPALGWTALGSPPGSKGFKYTGSAVGDTTCSIVLIKPTVIKGVCKGTGVTLTTPFASDDGIIISIPAASTLGPQARYCADLGGTTQENDSTALKRTDAPRPVSCPSTSLCKISQGRYTETTTGGVVQLATFSTFPFPAGETIVQDVSAPDANCVSQTVVPFPGGLSVPVFCQPALGLTLQMTQTGCGVGIIDSNGGSDLTVDEKGDTSFTGSSGMCAAGQSCASSVDSSGEIDITVGDGTADTCPSGGTGNAVVSIPVLTTYWAAADNSCPDADKTYNPGTDHLVFQVPQTLDLTTDRATAEFADNDADGCSLAGVGPAGPYTTNQVCFAAGNPYACCTGVDTGTCVGNGATGTCIAFGAQTVKLAAAGTIFSESATGGELDLLFTTVQNSNISGPAAFGGATCLAPPVINFTGSAQRCMVGP
jgi:hypothetical protein